MNDPEFKNIIPKDRDKVITASTLISRRSIYNLNPPYQRDEVWQEEWKRDLIISIIKDLPLAPISLVEHKKDDGSIEYLVLDGKQRLSSFYGFFDGKFTIPVTNSNGKVENVTYKRLSELDDSKSSLYEVAKDFQANFPDFKFRAIVYPDLDLSSQIALFKTINHNKPISKFEIFNSEYVFAKAFTSFIIDNYLPNWVNFTSKTKKSLTNDGKGFLWYFRLIYCLMGGDLSDPIFNGKMLPPDNCISINPFKNFMKLLDDKIKNYMFDKKDHHLFSHSSNKDRVEKMLQEFKWNKFKKNLETLNTVLGNVLSYRDTHSRVYNLIYFCFYLCEELNSKRLTDSQIFTNKDLVKDLYVKYYDWTSSNTDNENAVRRVSTEAGRDYHFNKIEDLFKNSNLDLGKKQQAFSDQEKKNIFDKANGKCEICGTSDNLQYDHILPASLNSTKLGGLLCGPCNTRKSDNDLLSLEKTKEYIELHTL
jgi:Protein of unknown function DUF262/Recombination endonuclease VII